MLLRSAFSQIPTAHLMPFAEFIGSFAWYALMAVLLLGAIGLFIFVRKKQQ